LFLVLTRFSQYIPFGYVAAVAAGIRVKNLFLQKIFSHQKTPNATATAATLPNQNEYTIKK